MTELGFYTLSSKTTEPYKPLGKQKKIKTNKQTKKGYCNYCIPSLNCPKYQHSHAGAGEYVNNFLAENI